MLLELKTLFAQQVEHELLQTTRDFYSCKQEEGHMGKTINELHAMLKLHEQTLPKNNAPALHAIRAAELLKKKKDAALGVGGSCIFVIELNTIFNRSWIYDTGCGTHICNTTHVLRASRKLKPGALSLYVGNGQREAVEAIGVFYLCLPSGLNIVLNNCHYAPSITREVISDSCLYEDGFINCFLNNTIQVSRNNMVYFSTIPRDGIFKIDLSNSYTNESFIYAVSNKRAKLDLDSTLLWHCRLGHIIKKRIEKLQHDGLTNLTNLRAFEKCVSCMSEKMARSPYTHQVKRAKDLFGLIHTDVCGPFKIMSRQGAYYFVTFTDDFSRYGYVYLLNHKHEVFETFKVFQKEVENQLDKTIKSLRSDRGGYPKETMGYSFYYPPENKVLVSWNAEFLENSLITQEASGSLEDLEIIQEEDTHPSIDTSLNHKEDDQEIDEPQSDIIPIRRSIRTRHAPNRMRLYIDADEHELGDLDNEVWVLVELPPNGKTVGSKWLFKKKTDIDGVVHTYKARLMAKGYTQTPGIHYKETFSPRYYMENSKRGSIPMKEKLKLSKSQGASTLAELKRMQNVPYALAVGSIMYAVRCSRPDVANTKGMFLVYGGDLKRELRVSCYTDAGYLTDVDDLKSQTGYVFISNVGAVDWKSTKQSIFATSSTEAEYIATFDASKEALW
nr:hypothetical protein [Tanacetum cinerariifolium]